MKQLLGDFCDFSENIFFSMPIMPFGWHFTRLQSHLKELIGKICKHLDRIKLLNSFTPFLPPLTFWSR